MSKVNMAPVLLNTDVRVLIRAESMAAIISPRSPEIPTHNLNLQKQTTATADSALSYFDVWDTLISLSRHHPP